MLKTTLAGASLAKDKSIAHVLILGGGRGGTALLEVLLGHSQWIQIDAIVDINPNAPAFRLAGKHHIPLLSDPIASIKAFEGDIIIDVTGNIALAGDIQQYRTSEKIEIISGNSAKLVFDLVCQQCENNTTIHVQDIRLNLLNSMLELSLDLEHYSDTASMLQQAMHTLHTSFLAKKTLALIPGECCCEAYAYLDGTTPLQLPESVSTEIQKHFSNWEQERDHADQFQQLSAPLSLPGITDVFDLAIPLTEDKNLIALLLISIEGELNDSTTMLLNIASSHIRLALKALRKHHQLEHQAICDPLTKIYNRGYFQTRIKQEVAQFKRLSEGSLSCIFFDLDAFKEINDTFGHQAGDAVLCYVAQKIQSVLRDYDIFARYGGDEFVALLPFPDKNEPNSKAIAQRILEELQKIKIDGYPELVISLSIGIGTISSEVLSDGQALVRLADQALYQAKASGKNCIINIEKAAAAKAMAA